MIHLAATVGDPASIGPEVALKALSDFFESTPDSTVTLYYPYTELKHIRTKSISSALDRGQLRLQSPLKLPAVKTPGTQSARFSLAALELAIDACSRSEASAMVTGPVDKSLCARLLPKFRGHTEFLRDKTKSKRTTMYLRSEDLGVGLVTTHLPLKDVSKNLTQEKIIATTTDVFEHLKTLSDSPRIGVCALNPHASDNGLLGTEEKKIISPAIAKLQKNLSKNIQGPLASDTIFWRRSDFDAIICMYHDQGLIPLKMQSFYSAINVTLGLPFLRTSVDHGTAFDLVGTEKASYTSYLKALQYAYEWVRLKNRNSGRTRA